MSLKQKIRDDRLSSRKMRDDFRTGTLSYILGQIELQEKVPNVKGDVCLSVVKSHVKSLRETIPLVGIDSDNGKRYQSEIQILEAYLPPEVDISSITDYVNEQINSGCANKGMLMKSIKAHFGDGVDMKKAGGVVDSLLNESK